MHIPKWHKKKIIYKNINYIITSFIIKNIWLSQKKERKKKN